MTSLHPYLTFPGNCEEAFNFYKSAFGTEFTYMGRFGEMPPSEDGKACPPGEENKIMHVSLPIGGDSQLMGSDASAAFGQTTVVGNNISLSLNVESSATADQLFNALSVDGNVTMAMDNTFWGAYFGMFTDKFGLNWMINFDETPQK